MNLSFRESGRKIDKFLSPRKKSKLLFGPLQSLFSICLQMIFSRRDHVCEVMINNNFSSRRTLTKHCKALRQPLERTRSLQTMTLSFIKQAQAQAQDE